MLVDGVVSTAVLVQPGRIYDIAAVLGLVPGVSQKNVGQLIAGVLQHVANVALALIVEEAVGCGVNVAQVLGTEGLNDVAGLVVQLYEVIRMGLALYADALTLDDREKLLHRLEEHAVADLLLVRVAGELGIDDRYTHVNRDFDHTLPVCNCVLALLLGRTGPAVNNDERGNFYTGLLESLLVLLLALLGEQRVLVERVDARMRGLLNVLVAPVCYLVNIIVDGHLLGKNVNVKCDFHKNDPPCLFAISRVASLFDGSIIKRSCRLANDTNYPKPAKSCYSLLHQTDTSGRIEARRVTAMLIPELGVHQTSERYFFTPSSLAKELFYYPTRLGHYFCSSRYSFNHRSEIALQGDHNQNIMLFFVHDGAMELTLNGTPAIAGAGQIVLFDCREPYSYAASDGLEFTWLLFNGLNARAFYQKILQARGRRAFSPAAPAEIAQMLDSLRSACAEDARLSEARCSQLIHRLLCLLLLDETTESTAGGDRIAQAIRYMNRHLFEPIGVQDAAAAVSLSPSHFSRQFKARTGYSPYEYIVLRRIDKAKYMLASTELSVKEIAYATGYNSEENFIHSFRKNVGVAPGIFRKYPV